jgi:hypothetical protein
MTPCQAEERAAVHSARDAIEADPETVATDALPPARAATGRWSLLILLERGAGGIPPAVGAVLADRGLTIRRSAPAGTVWRALATA